MKRLILWPSGYALFWCPGCNESHAINITKNGKGWKLDGDCEKPVTQPSIRVSSPNFPGQPERTLCHCYLEGDKIRFCSDSPNLPGQTVDLPLFPLDRLTQDQLKDTVDKL